VFSDDQLEARKGVFNDFQGDIFIRQVREVREVKKYPWIKSKWILERWAAGDISHHPDLVTVKNGVYVCVYVYQDKNFNYLPPLLKVAEIIIRQLLKPRTRGEAIAQDQIIEEKKEKVEVAAIEESIIIQSDEIATKDSKSSRESMSSGYSKETIKNE
jgi:hypothetical protein